MDKPPTSTDKVDIGGSCPPAKGVAGFTESEEVEEWPGEGSSIACRRARFKRHFGGVSLPFRVTTGCALAPNHESFLFGPVSIFGGARRLEQPTGRDRSTEGVDGLVDAVFRVPGTVRTKRIWYRYHH